MEGPPEWFTPQVVEKNALAFMAGAVSSVMAFLQLLKSKVIVLGDNAEKREENAVLKSENAELRKDLAEAKAELAKLRGGGQG